jgi:hypothetical protein
VSKRRKVSYKIRPLPLGLSYMWERFNTKNDRHLYILILLLLLFISLDAGMVAYSWNDDLSLIGNLFQIK